MLVKSQEIHEIEDLLQRVEAFNRADGENIENPKDVDFFVDRPHLLMPLGFDEFRAVATEPNSQDFLQNQQNIPIMGFESSDLFVFPYESFYRESLSGAWHWFEGITHYHYVDGKAVEEGKNYLHFIGRGGEHNFKPVDTWMNTIRRMAEEPTSEPYTLLLPGMWTPRIQLEQRIALADTIPDLLHSIHNQQTSLRDIHWRQLEEVIAELLRSHGLEIFVTPRAHDGGRDIIARGELIPGEPTAIAVEVKQKSVVGLEDVQRALRANEDFPALMVATAGRFSAGVIKERGRNRNHLRLFLKDGVALRQWIDSYSLHNRWKKTS